MKDFSLTKEELEAKLLALDATRDGFKPVGIFAMCYSPAMMMEDDIVPKTCKGCGKQFDVIDVQSYGDENALDIYNKLAEKYQALGYDAHIQCYCDECVETQSLPRFKGEKTNVFFAFRTRDINEYHLTPLGTQYCYDDELKMVLEFLKGAESYKDLDKSYAGVSLFQTADGFKECIKRILGLEL